MATARGSSDFGGAVRRAFAGSAQEPGNKTSVNEGLRIKPGYTPPKGKKRNVRQHRPKAK